MKANNKERLTVTVIATCFNEERVLPLFWKALFPVFKKLENDNIAPRLLLVDDGSQDATWRVIQTLCENDARVSGCSFSRNFGQAAALTCGYRLAVGEAVVSMDTDLQDPPQLIPAMIKAWREGAQIVYARRKSRVKDTWFKKITAATFYRLFRWLTGVEAPEQVGDFRLVDRLVVNAINAMGEKARFFRGMVAWTGFASVMVEYDRPERAAGKSKYPFKKMFNFAHRGISSFTTLPLYLGFFVGFLLLAMVCLYLAYAMAAHWLWGVSFERGWFSLILVQTLIGVLLFFCIGMIGVYVAHLFEEAKARPDYLIARRAGKIETRPFGLVK